MAYKADHEKLLKVCSTMSNTITNTMSNTVSKSKYDLIAIVHIFETEYYRIYRRYNDLYEIVIIDYLGALHYQTKDVTVSATLMNMLCLDAMTDLVAINAHSFTHCSDTPLLLSEIPYMTWVHIQKHWNSIYVNFSVPGYFNRYNGMTDTKYTSAFYNDLSVPLTDLSVPLTDLSVPLTDLSVPLTDLSVATACY
jgi:hypothetical protein